MKFIYSSAYCQSCGENVSKEIAFCRSCGTALSEEQVRINIEQSRKETPLRLGTHRDAAPIVRKIAGTALVGVLEFFFVVIVFFASLFISTNFLPSASDNYSGSLSAYFVIMTTALVAGLMGGSSVAKILGKKYHRKIEYIKKYFALEKSKA